MMFNRHLKSEMPKVKLPGIVIFFRATGALFVCITGFDSEKNEWIYTTQFRLWHPLSWLLFIGFCAKEGFLAAPQFFIRAEWRASNG
jgi:hypothetical protein